MRIALYLRRSTIDLQPDSLAAQEERLRGWAAERGHEVVSVYRDSASGRSTKKRDAFLGLIEVVKSGKAGFEAIVVRDVSRWSRSENIDEAGYYEFLCRSHAVKVIYTDEVFDDDASPYAVLLKNVKRAMAAEFSAERAKMTIGSQARLVRQGFWPSGSVPYGMRRALVDRDGNVTRVLMPGEHKSLANERLKLVPGDPAQVETVRRIFSRYALDGATSREIAEELNEAGVRGSKGGSWSSGAVTYLLRTEPYVGDLVYRIRHGKNRSELHNLSGSDSPDIVRCTNAHVGLVSRELWDAAQAKLSAKSWRRSDRELTEELCVARANWWNQPPVPDDADAEALRRGFGSTDALVVEQTLGTTLEKLRRELSTSFHITALGDCWLLDHLLLVGFRASLPRARLARLEWQFTTEAANGEDVVLGLCFSPPPLIEHVDTIFFRVSKRWETKRTIRIGVDPGVARTVARRSDVTELVSSLRCAISFRNHRAEVAFLSAAAKHDRLSLAALAKDVERQLDLWCRRQLDLWVESPGFWVS